MRQEKSGSVGIWLIALLVVAWGIMAIPKGILIFIVVVGLIVVVTIVVSNANSPKSKVLSNKPEKTLSEIIGPPKKIPKNPVGWSKSVSNTEVFFRSSDSENDPQDNGYRIPSPPPGVGKAEWIAADKSVSIAGLTIPGGLFYFGTGLKNKYGQIDPCLINPNLRVAQDGDLMVSQLGYWSSYHEISPTARRAYLKWLAGGRQHLKADIGFVFLFFYGLERRAIAGMYDDIDAHQDRPAIVAEVKRLLSIYGDKSSSFKRYASELLDWLFLAAQPKQLYLQPVPYFPNTYELPGYMRLALGQAAVDKAPLPVDLVLAWLKLDLNFYRRTPATRCTTQFDQLFRERYAEVFDAGYVLPRNKTRFKYVYRPATASLRGYDEVNLNFGDIPDISVLTAPVKKIQTLIDQCVVELEPYSRFLGRNPGSTVALEGMLLLPPSLWPDAARNKLTSLRSKLAGNMLALSFGELISLFGGTEALSKDKAQGLARALEASHIGIEPNVLAGAKTPTAEDMVILFSDEANLLLSPETSAYRAAMLTLQLASALANADGDFSKEEVKHLEDQVHAWHHLTPSHRQRLLAHLRLLTISPVSLPSLKKKVEVLDVTSKEAIAAFIATLSQADGVVSPSEVKFLEKLYKTLGVEPKRVFSDLHASATGSRASTSAEATVGFTLDAARIAKLQKDTDKVSALLANIFKEEEVTPVVAVSEPEDEDVKSTTHLLGLDTAHSSLARMLLSRPHWTRAELEDVASDLELMLDGALEQINEAAFDAYDIPFTEGDDPIEVSVDVLEKIEG